MSGTRGSVACDTAGDRADRAHAQRGPNALPVASPLNMARCSHLDPSIPQSLNPFLPRFRPSAFTLVELLIVIAILAILTAVLLPSLHNARLDSRRAVCLSNLRQLGLATNYYLADNRDAFWRYFWKVPDGRLWWFGFEPDGPGSGTGRPLDRSESVFARYLQTDQDRLLCPSFPYEAGCYFPKFAVHTTTYGFNILLGPPNTRVPTARRGQFREATSSIFVLADGAHFDHNPGTNEGHYIEYKRDTRALSGYGHFRHRGRANVLYLDGHAASQSLHGQPHPTECGGPAGNLSSPGGGPDVYGPDLQR